MVRANELTADAVTDAMRRGDFYASSGVMLKDVWSRDGACGVRIDLAGTERELESNLLMGRLGTIFTTQWRDRPLVDLFFA